MNKKMYGLAIVAGILLAMMPVAVIAFPDTEADDAKEIQEEPVLQEWEEGTQAFTDIETEDAELIPKEPFLQEQTETLKQQRKKRLQIGAGVLPSDVPQRKQAKIRGIWGYEGDNESDGYFGGPITRGQHAGFFKGLWNTTDNEQWGSIEGIMKRGYFNGRVMTANGDIQHITGLYKIDREQQLFKLRWMTPHGDGWAIAKIAILNQ